MVGWALDWLGATGAPSCWLQPRPEITRTRRHATTDLRQNDSVIFIIFLACEFEIRLKIQWIPGPGQRDGGNTWRAFRYRNRIWMRLRADSSAKMQYGER